MAKKKDPDFDWHLACTADCSNCTVCNFCHGKRY